MALPSLENLRLYGTSVALQLQPAPFWGPRPCADAHFRADPFAFVHSSASCIDLAKPGVSPHPLAGLSTGCSCALLWTESTQEINTVQNERAISVPSSTILRNPNRTSAQSTGLTSPAKGNKRYLNPGESAYVLIKYLSHPKVLRIFKKFITPVRKTGRLFLPDSVNNAPGDRKELPRLRPEMLHDQVR